MAKKNQTVDALVKYGHSHHPSQSVRLLLLGKPFNFLNFSFNNKRAEMIKS